MKRFIKLKLPNQKENVVLVNMSLIMILTDTHFESIVCSEQQQKGNLLKQNRTNGRFLQAQH